MVTPLDARIDQRIRTFRGRLASQDDEVQIVDEFLLHGSCHGLDDGSYFQIKRRIADRFDLHVESDIFVVGSAKLGFSISPRKLWRPYDGESDIDVAIVSRTLYERAWHELYDYARSGADWPERQRFFDYHARGWLRPDMAPSSPMLVMGSEWWEFFRELKLLRIAGARKINAAIYHDAFFLRRYQAAAVAACRQDLSNAN